MVINAGDGNREKFFIKDIINTPINFNKYYDFALHIRLEDRINIFKMINNKKVMTTLSLDSIKKVIDNIQFTNNSCIVIKKPSVNYEKKILQEIIEYIFNTKNINIKVESNDIITDFHIMKNAKILACSVSTISWCAAYFSKRIKKCYMPDYPKEVNGAGYCKKPIDNTELYNYT